LTAVICTLILAYLPLHYFFAYFVFASALIITIRTDAEFMLIPQLCSLYVVPIGIVFSIIGRLPIAPLESVIGALLGYSTLAIIAYIYKKYTGHTGLGDGDPELLAGIGAFVGINGVWYTMLIGSLSATVYAGILIYLGHAGTQSKIPFGPFLALGALATLFLSRT
jgi:leader peptidase (prepilin peptidase)/N-methyltransferase